ncbi:hypothetical protein PR202_ga25363 [Eleusine coracana subsp. coracana]|uniref:Uncharacterized protein n=1 Tax=Eleusine coracana subsp. coracana TaxID=191504 RepID=A0AAV5DC32_ELECO|nr:hypothetical protein PR202_ga25363 [Eleusine coracana subsp. coracana]
MVESAHRQPLAPPHQTDGGGPAASSRDRRRAVEVVRLARGVAAPGRGRMAGQRRCRAGSREDGGTASRGSHPCRRVRPDLASTSPDPSTRRPAS